MTDPAGGRYRPFAGRADRFAGPVTGTKVRDKDSTDRPGRRSGRLLVAGGGIVALLGVALFGAFLAIRGPLPDTLAEFAQRWAVRGVAAVLVFGGLWCAWTGWKRLR